MATTRTYGQSCPVAHALDMVGDRWALLVVRELRLGPRRFADLQTALPGVGPSVLTQRLRELVVNGVVERRPVPAPARGEMYGLTDWGSELEPVFRALARWGASSPMPLQGPISDDAVMLGVRTFLSAPTLRRRPPTGRFLVRLGTDQYHLTISDTEAGGSGDTVSVLRSGRARTGEPDDSADTVLESDATAVQRLLVGLDEGDAITLSGDRRRARRLVHALHGIAATT